MRRVTLWRTAAAVLTMCAAAPAFAVDGCKVFLCMAGNWRNVAECKGEVEQALKDVALGKGWPTCGMSGGAANVAKLIYPDATTCLPWYQQWTTGENGAQVFLGCAYPYMVSMTVNGAAWEDVFIDLGGTPLTCYYAPATAALGVLSDAGCNAPAGWGAPPPETPPEQGGSGG